MSQTREKAIQGKKESGFTYSINICMDLSEFLNMGHFFLKKKFHFLAELAQVLFFIFSCPDFLQQALLQPLETKRLLPAISPKIT